MIRLSVAMVIRGESAGNRSLCWPEGGSKGIVTRFLADPPLVSSPFAVLARTWAIWEGNGIEMICLDWSLVPLVP